VSFHETHLVLNNKKQMRITLAEVMYRWLYSLVRIAVVSLTRVSCCDDFIFLYCNGGQNKENYFKEWKQKP